MGKRSSSKKSPVSEPGHVKNLIQSSVEEAVKRDVYGLDKLKMLALPGYAVHRQPGGQDLYYIAIWRKGTMAVWSSSLSSQDLGPIEIRARNWAARETGGLFIELKDTDFLFHTDKSGVVVAYPMEMSNARLEDGSFKDISDYKIPVEIME